MSLGKIPSWVEQHYRTYQEEVAGALDDKEYLLLEPGAADNSVKLNTAAGNEIGTLFQKLQQATGKKDDVNVRMFGGVGTLKVVQNAAIGFGKKVIVDPAAPTKVKELPTAAGTYKVKGRKVSEGGGAQNDVIEITDQQETVIVATAYVMTSTNGTAAAAADLAALKAESENIGDDVRAIYAALVNKGIMS